MMLLIIAGSPKSRLSHLLAVEIQNCRPVALLPFGDDNWCVTQSKIKLCLNLGQRGQLDSSRLCKNCHKRWHPNAVACISCSFSLLLSNVSGFAAAFVGYLTRFFVRYLNMYVYAALSNVNLYMDVDQCSATSRRSNHRQFGDRAELDLMAQSCCVHPKVDNSNSRYLLI